MRVKPVIAYGLLIVEVWSIGQPHQKKQSTQYVLHVSGEELTTKLHQLNYQRVLRKCVYFNSNYLVMTHIYLYASRRRLFSFSIVLEKVELHIKIDCVSHGFVHLKMSYLMVSYCCILFAELFIP